MIQESRLLNIGNAFLCIFKWSIACVTGNGNVAQITSLLPQTSWKLKMPKIMRVWGLSGFKNKNDLTRLLSLYKDLSKKTVKLRGKKVIDKKFIWFRSNFQWLIIYHKYQKVWTESDNIFINKIVLQIISLTKSNAW